MFCCPLSVLPDEDEIEVIQRTIEQEEKCVKAGVLITYSIVRLDFDRIMRERLGG